MKKPTPYLKYTGAALQHYHPELQLEAYIPSPDLIQAVEVARFLGRPLLLRGEPGSGKTRLAEAIAVELHGEGYRDFYFPWPIKSTTKAQDGLYEFDHLQRMQDLYQIRESNPGKKDQLDPSDYVRLGPIGQAYEIMNQSPQKPPPVILIDEIDKADIDFPNDLLWELDKREFFISEQRDDSGKPKRVGIEDRDTAPVVIITSNDEKELPNAFLRRCLFHYVAFPANEQLKTIISEFLKGIGQTDLAADDNRTHPILERFDNIRKGLQGNPNAIKPPSTSELLDWTRILAIYLSQDNWSVDADMNLLYKGAIQIRPEQVLLKNRDDQRLIQNT